MTIHTNIKLLHTIYETLKKVTRSQENVVCKAKLRSTLSHYAEMLNTFNYPRTELQRASIWKYYESLSPRQCS